jgi:hypothetical protein
LLGLSTAILNPHPCDLWSRPQVDHHFRRWDDSTKGLVQVEVGIPIPSADIPKPIVDFSKDPIFMEAAVKQETLMLGGVYRRHLTTEAVGDHEHLSIKRPPLRILIKVLKVRIIRHGLSEHLVVLA